jgi:hypothetical protein
VAAELAASAVVRRRKNAVNEIAAGRAALEAALAPGAEAAKKQQARAALEEQIGPAHTANRNRAAAAALAFPVEAGVDIVLRFPQVFSQAKISDDMPKKTGF